MPPRLITNTATQLAKQVDLAFAGTALNPPRALRRRSSAEGLLHAQRMLGLEAIAAFYDRDEFAARRSALFPASPAIEPAMRRVRRIGKRGPEQGEVLDLTWPSAFSPLWTTEAVAAHFESLPLRARERLGLGGDRSLDDIIRDIGIDRSGALVDKYLRAERNRTAHARWYRHEAGPRPCVVLLHGYMTGAYAIEERLWPVQALFERGFDVVISVLPFHGPRRSERRGLMPPAFPSSDPRFTIEGFRQLVGDQTALFDYLLAGRAVSVGVMGMSLGGFSAALLGTLDERLRFGVFVIPLAAIEDFAQTHGRFIGDEAEQQAQYAAMARAQAKVSPLSRPPLIAPDRTIVLAGEADRVTGVDQARRLGAHFGVEPITFGGGHLLQFGLRQAFGPVWNLLDTSCER